MIVKVVLNLQNEQVLRARHADQSCEISTHLTAAYLGRQHEAAPRPENPHTARSARQMHGEAEYVSTSFAPYLGSFHY